MDVRPPTHWSERIRVIVFLILYTVLAEYTAPTPFIQSRFGKLVYFLIVAYIFKEFWRYREEISPRSHKRANRIRDRLALKKSSFSDFTKFRLQRIVRVFFLAYAAGWLLDGVTDRCTGAVQCAFLAPKLLTENLPELLMFGVRLAMSMMGIFLMMYVMAKMDLYTIILPDSIETRFNDVYGQDKAVMRVKENLEMLDRPDYIEAKGGYMPGGILLEGPPGTGKTMIAEAFAGETGKPFVFLGPGSFSNMFVGVPILKVKMLFRQLRKLSVKYGGVVCFMDEIDSLGNRGAMVADHAFTSPDCVVDLEAIQDKVVVTPGGGQGQGALEAFLAEMSGLAKPKGLYNRLRVLAGFKPVPPPKYRILFLGATNLAQRLDPALLRPGRFDRRVKVNYPDLKGRVATLTGYLNKINHDLTDEQIERLAKENPRATGASIKDIVNEAVIKSDREGRDIVHWDDVRDSVIWKSLGENEGEHEHEDDRRRVALHEAAHAVAAHHFRPNHHIQFASIHKRGHTGGVVASVIKEERFGQTKEELTGHIKVALASKWAEEFYFDGDISTGPSNDLQKATAIARSMVAQYSMGDLVGVWDVRDGITEIPSGIIAEYMTLLEDVYNDLTVFLHAHRDQVEMVAALLEDEGTVDGTVIHELLERMT